MKAEKRCRTLYFIPFGPIVTTTSAKTETRSMTKATCLRGEAYCICHSGTRFGRVRRRRTEGVSMHHLMTLYCRYQCANSTHTAYGCGDLDLTRTQRRRETRCRVHQSMAGCSEGTVCDHAECQGTTCQVVRTRSRMCATVCYCVLPSPGTAVHCVGARNLAREFQVSGSFIAFTDRASGSCTSSHAQWTLCGSCLGNSLPPCR